MRVLYIHQYYATPSSNGGVRSYLISKALVEKGHNVEILTSSAFVPSHWELLPGWNLVIVDGVKVNILNLPYSNKASLFKRLLIFTQFSFRSTLKALSIKCDVVFASSTPLTVGIPGVLASKRHRVPLVFEVRDLWPEIPIAMGILKSPLLIYIARKFEKWVYFNSKRVIALSPGMLDGVVMAGYERNSVIVAPNACDLGLFNVSVREGSLFRSRHSWLGSRKLVVYTGTFGKVNNLSYLMDVAYATSKLEPDICFVLIGDGAEKEKLVDLAFKKGILKKNVFFLPSVTKEELPAILSASDVCVSTVLPLPELWNNSANKFFDGLAAGKPIAINHGGWQADIIDSNNIGVVMNHDDCDEGARALVELVSSPERLERACQGSRRLAIDEYSAEKMTSIVIELLEGVYVLKRGYGDG